MESIIIKGDKMRMDACVAHLINKIGNAGDCQIVRLTLGNVEYPTTIVEARDKPTRECAAIKFTLKEEGILVESDVASWFDIGTPQLCGMLQRWHYAKISKSMFMDAMSFFTSD